MVQDSFPLDKKNTQIGHDFKQVILNKKYLKEGRPTKVLMSYKVKPVHKKIETPFYIINVTILQPSNFQE